MLLVAAVAEQYPGKPGTPIIEASTVVMLAMGVFGFRKSRSLFRTGIVFAVTVLLFVIAGTALRYLSVVYVTTWTPL